MTKILGEKYRKLKQDIKSRYIAGESVPVIARDYEVGSRDIYYHLGQLTPQEKALHLQNQELHKIHKKQNVPADEKFYGKGEVQVALEAEQELKKTDPNVVFHTTYAFTNIEANQACDNFLPGQPDQENPAEEFIHCKNCDIVRIAHVAERRKLNRKEEHDKNNTEEQRKQQTDKATEAAIAAEQREAARAASEQSGTTEPEGLSQSSPSEPKSSLADFITTEDTDK